MSDQIIVKVRTYIQEDTTLAKYRLAKFGSSANNVVAATAATAFIIGPTTESANSTAGDPVGIPVPGSIVKVVMSAAAAVGAQITATTGGKGVATTTSGHYSAGFLLEASAADGDIVKMLVLPHVVV